MYENDIRVDQEGNSVLENGDFALTVDDREFIINMLLSTPGSWKNHQTLGVGLEKFIGEQNNEETISRMTNAITTFFKNYALFPLVTIRPVDSISVVCKLEFSGFSSESSVSLIYSFTFENGTIKFFNTENKLATSQEIAQTRKTLSKYLDRRK